MFPVSDVIPSRRTPYVTIGLIALNSIVFLYEFRLSAEELQLLVGRYGVIPAEVGRATLVTSVFLHAGWLHFLGNMLYLWIFGDNVEDRLGHARFLVFFLACGGAAAMGHVFANPGSDVPLIGASGAIAGVMGAYFVLYPRSRVLAAVFLVVYLDLIEIPALYFLGIWFLMQLSVGLATMGAEVAAGASAIWAHVAGFLAGALTGAAMKVSGNREYWRPSRKRGASPPT
jgi:membrane associated rhomboid family serine protease